MPKHGLRRAAQALGVSLLLHLLLMAWLGARSETPALPAGNLEVLLADMDEAPPAPAPVPQVSAAAQTTPATPAAPAAPAVSRRAPQPAPAAHLSQAPQTEEEQAPQASPAPTPQAEATPTPTPTPSPAPSATPAPQPVNTNDNPQAGAPTPPLPRYQISAPPNGRAEYTVLAHRRGNEMQGKAEFEWRVEGKHYHLRAETSMLFITIGLFESDGEIDENGLAPTQYAEKRMRRPQTLTHFNRPKPDLPPHPTNGNTISFSASSATYPRLAGAQDRISLLWQLAGIGRAQPELFQTGAELAFYVAGVRDAEVWRMQVLGLENVRIAEQEIAAWHVRRTPRAGSYEQQLDLWLAPAQGWLPLRILYTETNGDTLQMDMRNLPAAQAPAESAPFNRKAEP